MVLPLHPIQTLWEVERDMGQLMQVFQIFLEFKQVIKLQVLQPQTFLVLMLGIKLQERFTVIFLVQAQDAEQQLPVTPPLLDIVLVIVLILLTSLAPTTL